MTKENPFVLNKHEIKYNVINSFIAGGLVFVGSLADGSIGATGILASIGAAFLACLIKFQSYWKSQENEYSAKLLNFI